MKIGIIGMSEGNAHPYSWSSIINGRFERNEIVGAGYPAVADYLEANRDTLGVDGAEVVCVWTQERRISESIARSANIAHIADRLAEMIPLVDAVILSRDDPENHVEMARPFLEAGLPLFIDKPLAYTREDLDWFAEWNSRGGLIMSCSSMRYAGECRTVKQQIGQLGAIELVTAVGKKDWKKYGVHMLEAMFSLLDDPRPATVRHVGKPGKDVVHIEFDNGIAVTVHLFMDISGTFQLTLYGRNGWQQIDIRNSYAMFRDNIIEFVRSVGQGASRLPFAKTENIIRTLIAARESAEQGGRTIIMSEF